MCSLNCLYKHVHACVFPVPTALRVNGPTNGLGVDGRPPLLSPSQVSLGPQSQGYRTADLGDSPGKPLPHPSETHIHYSFIIFSILTSFSVSSQYLPPWTRALQRSATGAGIPPRWCPSHQQPSLFQPSDPSFVPQVSSWTPSGWL